MYVRSLAKVAHCKLYSPCGNNGHALLCQTLDECIGPKVHLFQFEKVSGYSQVSTHVITCVSVYCFNGPVRESGCACRWFINSWGALWIYVICTIQYKVNIYTGIGDTEDLICSIVIRLGSCVLWW